MSDDTIYALSSGRPPAAIAVVRVSGPAVARVATRLSGALPYPRRATLRTLRDDAGQALDRALVMFFPGPGSATGEDLLELHLHGGRAVVAAVETVLGHMPGLRRAEPGEFTRRALSNGRIDLAQAEGLADLLEAETDAQRRNALALSDGVLSQRADRWMTALSDAAAMVEAAIDYDGEDEVGQVDMDRTTAIVDRVQAEMQSLLDQPSTERLRDGLVVVLAGPRNAGKSSLFNALVEREAAIVTSIAGTTRDALEAQVVRAGVPFRLVDTAGLVEETDDPVERIGIARARGLIGEADILLWLGSVTDAPAGAWLIAAKADLCTGPGIPTSIHQPESVAALWSRLVEHGSSMLSAGDDLSLSQRQREIVSHVLPLLASTSAETDILIKADHLRVARKALGALTGRDATIALLDALFGRFCLGK